LRPKDQPSGGFRENMARTGNWGYSWVRNPCDGDRKICLEQYPRFLLSNRMIAEAVQHQHQFLPKPLFRMFTHPKQMGYLKNHNKSYC
jgi:hypothetical protein